MVVADESARLFSERLAPSPTAWLIAPGVAGLFFVMFLPTGTFIAAGAAALTGALTALGLWSLAAKVELTPTHLTVGRAQIEVEALGMAQTCSAKDMTFYMGPGSDARSHVLTRPWVKGGVYVEQIDSRDPTPFWLFSTRRGEKLLAELDSLRPSR